VSIIRALDLPGLRLVGTKWLYVTGILLMAGFAIMGSLELSQTATPSYRLVREVKKAGDTVFQFTGEPVKSSVHYGESSDEFVFKMRDVAGEVVTVRFKGLKPTGFDFARRIVVRGTYRGSEIIATQVLIPSSRGSDVSN